MIQSRMISASMPQSHKTQHEHEKHNLENTDIKVEHEKITDPPPNTNSNMK